MALHASRQARLFNHAIQCQNGAAPWQIGGEWIDLFGENVRDEGGISLELIYNASKITISEMKNEYLQLLNSETVANIKSLIDNNQTTELTEKLKCY